ncbi:zinc finger HIT domain-containing protein 1 isoform X1 [Macaca fascicularis]|uniref:zinc finger HIT domain-containing protein 1 isoform X1 n=1 Tax=Macaca fascicularis TaxID=9541 RepID=UPI0032B07CC3
MVEKKTSVRSQDPGQRRVLDRAARQRRINRQLEALENDNFQDDPHAGLPQLGKRLPQFDDDADTGKKKKKTRGDHFKLRFRKNFQALLEEQVSEVDCVSLGIPREEAPLCTAWPSEGQFHHPVEGELFLDRGRSRSFTQQNCVLSARKEQPHSWERSGR